MSYGPCQTCRGSGASASGRTQCGACGGTGLSVMAGIQVAGEYYGIPLDDGLPAPEQEPVAVVDESFVCPKEDGKYLASVVSDERLSVGAELFTRPKKCARCEELGRKLKSDGRMIDNYIGHVATQKATNEDLQAKLSTVEKDAERFEALQNMPIEQAQAFFWNFSSRTERAKAIDDAIAEYKKREKA